MCDIRGVWSKAKIFKETFLSALEGTYIERIQDMIYELIKIIHLSVLKQGSKDDWCLIQSWSKCKVHRERIYSLDLKIILKAALLERFHVYEETRYFKIIMKTKQSQWEDTDEEYTVWYKIVFIGIK